MRALALLVLAGLSAAPPALGALSYERFRHPQGDYVVAYPSDWKRSVGIETLKLRPDGAAGKLVRVSIEKHPFGSKEAATPEAFIAEMLTSAEGFKRLDARDTIKVSGKDAERLVLTETTALKGTLGTLLPGPMTEVVVVVPFGKGFYALRLTGTGGGLAAARPEFDRLVAGLKLGSGAR